MTESNGRSAFERSSPLARLMALVKGVDSALTDTADPTLRTTFGLAGLKAIAAEVQTQIAEMQIGAVNSECEHSARDAAILERHAQGVPLREIAVAFNISHERVRQIIRRAKQGAVEGQPFLLDTRCEDVLQLPTRARQCLASLEIRTVRDLLTFREADLLRTPNFGRRSLREITAELARYAYRLGDLDPSQRGDYCGVQETSPAAPPVHSCSHSTSAYAEELPLQNEIKEVS
jgi:DNA-binding CsgD family transcriptional regulator